MDEKRFESNPNFGLNQSATRLVDRISELPDEITVVILSFLSLREAAKTSVLSSRWVDLWKHAPNPNSDRISRLPHSIIIRILSFLPLKEAAATSVLCSRWPVLWKHTTNLDFNTYMLKLDMHAERNMHSTAVGGLWDAETCKYVQLVNSVIKSHKAPSLKRFNISLRADKSATRIVAKWLEFAFSRGVERLVLELWDSNSSYIVVLEELLRESGLCSSPETLILFKSLKSLRIQCLSVSGEAVKIFLRNCPLLEELIIGGSCVISSAVEVCRASLLLKHLEVSGLGRGKKSLRVSAPNLTRLKFSDTVGKLFLESLPKLVEAEFEFQDRRVDVIQNVAPALFRFSSQLEILKLTLQWPKEFLEHEFPEMPKLRKLVVKYYGVKAHSLLPVTALLWASPRLQEFKLVFREIHHGDAPIQVRRNGERCPHLHLKLFELIGFCDGSLGHIELATYISDNCTGLEKINVFIGTTPVFGTRNTGPSCVEDYKQAARNYAHQQLQGKLPQHIQLQIFYYYHL